MLHSTISNYLKEVVKVYDHATECLSSEDVTIDMLTNAESKVNACYKKIEYFLVEIERLSRLTVPENANIYQQSAQNLKRIKTNLGKCILQLKTTREEQQNKMPYEAILFYNDEPGRPRYIIEKEQLLFLREFGFHWKKIALMLGVSVSSIYRRRREFSMSRHHNYMPDTDLDHIITTAKEQNPQWGMIMLEGHINGMGFHVPRTRIMASMSRVDPLYSSLRWTAPIERRRYRVAGPGSLWHIDGNHKLVRYGIYIHGGIDGFSRLVTFLHASCNNTSQTVLNAFLKATEEHHFPSRIRTDLGTENVLIGEYITNKRPQGHNAWLRGSSVHNQRIERLWRDVRHAVLNYWRTLFRKLEDDRLLDVNSKSDIIALQYVYLEEINSHLQQFVHAWNHHKLRTERQATPWQLYISGMLQRYGSTYTSISEVFDNFESVDNEFGIDVNFDDINIDDDLELNQNATTTLNALPLLLREILERRVPQNVYTPLKRFKRAKRACLRFFTSAE